MRAPAASNARACAFQSAPGREAGRCGEAIEIPAKVAVFQSAPGREAGRCARAVEIEQRVVVVSIRARP